MKSQNSKILNIYSIKPLLLAVIALFVVSSCNQDEPKTEKARPTGLSVRIAGAGDFGKVSISDVRYSRILVTNYDPTEKFITINQGNLSAGNFKIDKIEGCTPSMSVRSGATCSLRIVFTPQIRGKLSETFTIAGQSVTFSGTGIIPALLTLSPVTWAAGNVNAAQPRTKRFTLVNDGDNAFEKPEISGSEKFRIQFTNCPEFLFPGDTCLMDITYQEEIAGFKTEAPLLLSSSGTSAGFVFTANVQPVDPSGIIRFDSFPAKMISNGSDEHNITARVFDAYGNPVADGHPVVIGGENINFPDGQNFTTSGGKVEFKIRSTTDSSDVEVLVQSGQGSGFFSIPSSSGPPHGTISFEPFNPRIRANGTSQLTVRTDLIKDVNNNVVDDGTQINVSATGVVDVVNPVVSVFQGRAFITVQAQTVADFSTVTVSGGTASGSFQVETIPLPPSGSFGVTSDQYSIYYENTAAAPYQATTNIEIGPVRDSGGNLVGAGKIVGISIRNGVATTKSPGNQNFDIQTDSDSIARFVLEGIAVRGWIDIEATVNGEVTSHQVWASSESEIRYLEGGSLSLSFSFNDSNTNRSLSPLDSSWETYIGDLSKIIDVNTQFIGGTFYAAGAKDLEALDLNNIYADCLMDIGEFFFVPPCSAYINNGTTFVGSTNPFTLGTFGGSEMYEYNNFGSRLTGGTNSPFDVAPFLIDYFYHKELDMALLVGGHNLTQSQTLTAKASDIVAYSYPSSLRTTFDPLYFDNYQGVVSGLGASGKAYLELNDSIYLYGGHNQEISSSSGSNITLSDGFIKIVFDGSAENTKGISVEQVDVSDDPSEESSPPALTGGSLYQRDDGRIFLIGGYYKDQTIVPNVLAHWDQIWSFNPEDSNPEWRKECDSCVPEIAGNYINQIQTLSYPVTVADLFLVESLPRRIEFIEDKTKNKVFAFDSRDSTIYSFDDQNLTFIDDTANAKAIAALYGESRVVRNSITGRYATVHVTDPARKKGRFRVYDGDLGQKRYYKFDFKLPEGAKFGAREYFINFSGRARANTTDGTNTVTQAGIGIYAFNHSTNQWDLVGVNTHVTDFDTFNNPDKWEINGTLSDYVSQDSVMSLMATTLYYPGLQLGGIKEGEGVLRIGHISLEGIW